MRRIALLALLAILTLPALALAQDVKYEKYTLDNGLTVILHEDHTIPVATINLWYRVGAKEEPRGRSGFAHLFEHLMFMGTERVPGSEFDNLMEAGGGSNNASTSLDRTNYFSTGPSSLLPTLLWLDADRMEDLGRTMTTEKLNKQRDVVRNEIRQQVENAPYGKSEEYVTHYMYPVGHPYYENVYGTHTDLEAANVNNVKDFFANFYLPNNCSLVVAGDFKSAEIKPLVAMLFSSITKGPPVLRREAKDVPVPVLGKVIRVTMLDKVELPKISYVYHSPASFQPGDAEMDLLGAVLTQGKSSRFYKRLVLDDKLANEVSASQNSATLGSLFEISVLAKPNADLNALEKAMDEEIAKILDSGIKDDELSQRKATIELGALSGLDNLGRKADKLNEYEYFFGEPNSFKRDLDRYRNATAAQIQDWAKKVLTQNSRLVMRTLPEQPGRDEQASPRHTRPADAAQGEFSPQSPETFALTSGVNVMFWKRSELPLVSMSMVVHPGGALVDNSKAGLAYLTGEMLGEGAGERNATQFADAVQSLGATFGAGADVESFTAGMTILKRNFEKGVELFADAVRRPRMAAEDFERVQRLHIDDLQQELENPQNVAGNVGARVLLGDKHPYALPVGGTVASAKTITLDDVRALHGAIFAPKSATILICGDLTTEQAKAALEKGFGDWKAAGAKHPAPPMGDSASAESSIPKADGLRIVIVDRPDAVQTVIRFVLPGPKAADPARSKYRLLNTILGGSFTSRLNQNLREKNGYTYGAGSRFAMQPMVGMFVARAAVKADVTGPALQEFFNEIARTRAGDISENEIGKAAQTVRTETIEGLAGIHGPIRSTQGLIAAGLPFSTISRDLAASMDINAADLNRSARDAIPMEKGVLVLVGDKKLILEQIKEMKLPTPVEMTPEGDRKGEGNKAAATKGD